MHSHCINKLLNLEDVIVKKVLHADSFVKIFIDYDTVKHIRPYLYSPEGSINFIANQIDEKNYFKNHGNYTFSYTKKAAFGDAIRNGVWLSFHDIQLK